ncbi:transglutaminase-like domain-containing protein [Microbacterium sp. A93]|uniref:transglutaminase-like domain-containing protein n=1 Tax=Microbacterium sp. A93 TaxID=3450716 RepID=UPI003F42829A
MVLATAVSLDAAFRDPLAGWLVPAAWPALGGLTVAAAVRSLGTRMLRPLAAGLLVAGWIWCRQWWPETLMAGLVPQRATLEAMAGSATDLRESIWTDIIPVASTDPLLAGLGALFAVTALVTDAVATGLRSPALAGLVPLALLGGAAALTAATAPWPALAVAAAAWLALLALDPGQGIGPTTRRRAGWTAGLGTVAAAAVGLLALSAAVAGLPVLTAGAAPEGQRIVLGPGAGPVNPAADLGQQLRSGSGYAGISYQTEDGQGRYLRTAVVDDVMASPWDANPPQYAGGPTTTELYPAAAHLNPDDLSAAGPGDPPWDLVSITLEGWRGHWAPLPDQTLALEPVVGEWGWQVDAATSTAYRQETTPVDVSYQAAIYPLDLRMEELADRAGALAPQGVFNRWGAAAELEGSGVQELAEELTAGMDNPVEQAVAIQDHLISDDFTYSETAPAEQGYDGSGLELTEQFLAAGAGYCIHFASAMVMMAQSVDIPARVVVGYAPVAATAGEHRVTADRAHSWPELYIDEVGWVPFEPTPTVGRTPSYAQQDPTTDPTPAADPTAGADADPSPTSSADAQSPSHDAGPGAEDGSGTSGAPEVPITTVLTVAGVLVLVALMLMLPAWLRHRRRVRRLATGSAAGSGSTAGAGPATDSGAAASSRSVLDAAPGFWDELEDTAVDLGIGRAPHESEQVFAARLGAHPALAEAMLRVRYAPAGTGPPPGPMDAPRVTDARELAVSVRATLAALEADAEPAVRRRARWFPRSLVPESLRR